MSEGGSLVCDALASNYNVGRLQGVSSLILRLLDHAGGGGLKLKNAAPDPSDKSRTEHSVEEPA